MKRLKHLKRMLERPFFNISPQIDHKKSIEESCIFVKDFKNGRFHDDFLKSELTEMPGLAYLTRNHTKDWEYRLFFKTLAHKNKATSIGLNINDSYTVAQDWKNQSEICEFDSFNNLIEKVNCYLLKKENFGFIQVFPNLNMLIKKFRIQASEELIKKFKSITDFQSESTKTICVEFNGIKMLAKYNYYDPEKGYDIEFNSNGNDDDNDDDDIEFNSNGNDNDDDDIEFNLYSDDDDDDDDGDDIQFKSYGNDDDGDDDDDDGDDDDYDDDDDDDEIIQLTNEFHVFM